MPALQFWNGRLLFRNGLLAMDPACCCDEDTSEGECCGIDMTSIEELFVTITGAVSGTGTLVFQSDPDGGPCRSYLGTISLDADDDCGDEIQTLVISVECPVGGTSPSDLEVSASGGGGGCTVMGGPLTDPAASAVPLLINVTFTTSELFPGGCPCGDGQAINIQITE